MVLQGSPGCVMARFGMAGAAWCAGVWWVGVLWGSIRRGLAGVGVVVRRGGARRGRNGGSGSVPVRHGQAWQARPGWVGSGTGMARSGRLGWAWQAGVRQGGARQGEAGEVGTGVAV